MTGITPHEQNGLNAPTAVAKMIAIIGRARRNLLIYFEAPDIRTATANGIVTSK